MSNNKQRKKSITHIKEYIVANLNEAEKKELTHICREIYQRFFIYPDDDYFINHRLFMPSLDTRIYLYYDRKVAIGYTMHTCTQVSSGLFPKIVLRASVYTSLEYKTDIDVMRLGIQCSLRAKRRWPLSHLYFCATANSPAVYALMARSFTEVYPKRTICDIPAKITKLRNETCKAIGYTQKSDEGWIITPPSRLKNASVMKTKMSIKNDPDARYYLKLNPNFFEGEALFVVIPLSVSNMLSLQKNYIQYKLKKILAA